MDKLTKRQFTENELARLSAIYDKVFDKICVAKLTGDTAKAKFYKKWEARLNDIDLRIRKDLDILQNDPCVLVKGDNNKPNKNRYPDCTVCTVSCRIKNIRISDEQVDFFGNV